LDNPSLHRLSGRILTFLPADLGYSLQISRGIQRFRHLHPQLVFIRTQNGADLNSITPDTCLGAIGFFSEEEHFRILDRLGIHHRVSISNRKKNLPCSQCITDDIRVGELAAEYFHRKKYRHVACHTLKGLYFSQLRSKGFTRWMKTHAGTEPIQLNEHSFGKGESDKLPFPLGLFCASDQNALNIQNQLRVQEISIPEDVAMVGVDDDELIAPYIPIPLSSIRLAGEKIGFEACLILEALIRKEVEAPVIRKIAPAGIRERKSSETVAVQNPLVRRVCAYVEENLSEIHDVSQLAVALHTSRRNLDRQFTLATGLTPAEWLMRRRVAYAEQLLRETDYTVEHVAERSGLSTKPRLYLSFRKLGRPLPSEIRRARKQASS